MSDSSDPIDGTAECKYCETELSGDDLAYRVLYGKFRDARDGNVSEKLVGRAGTKLDPGVREEYICLSCYNKHHDRAKGAHFYPESSEQLWSILEAANGSLIANTAPLSIGGKEWIWVEDGKVQAHRSVVVEGGDDVEWDLGFETEPIRDFSAEEFHDVFEFQEHDQNAPLLLQSVQETPFGGEDG